MFRQIRRQVTSEFRTSDAMNHVVVAVIIIGGWTTATQCLLVSNGHHAV